MFPPWMALLAEDRSGQIAGWASYRRVRGEPVPGQGKELRAGRSPGGSDEGVLKEGVVCRNARGEATICGARKDERYLNHGPAEITEALEGPIVEGQVDHVSGWRATGQNACGRPFHVMERMMVIAQ